MKFYCKHNHSSVLLGLVVQKQVSEVAQYFDRNIFKDIKNRNQLKIMKNFFANLFYMCPKSHIIFFLYKIED